MSEKRFKTKYYLKGKQGIILGVVKVNEEENVLHWNEVVELLNRLNDENERLKQQLLYDGDDVCDICKHEYLVPWDNYFISKCKKGHEECSKEDIEYCEDFESKGVYDDC